jgi:hypothetical protein
MRIDQPGKENSSEQGSEVEQALAPSFTKPITADAVFETTQVTSSDIAVSKAEAASNLSNPILSIDYPKDGILMTAQDIVTAYRLFLRRQPENDAVIASRVGLPRE